MHSVTLLSILICVLSVCSIARADFQCYPSDCCPQFRQFDGTNYFPVQSTAPGTVCKGGQQVLPSQCTTPCASNPVAPTQAPSTTAPTVAPATSAPATNAPATSAPATNAPATSAPTVAATLAPAVPASGSCSASVLLAKTAAWANTQQYALTVVNNGKCSITSALVTFAMASDSQITPGFWGMTQSGSSYAVSLYGNLAAAQSVSGVGFSMQFGSSPAISASVAVTCSNACSSGATAVPATAAPAPATAAPAPATAAPAPATAAPAPSATIAPTTAPAPPVQPIQKVTPGVLNYPLKVVYIDYMIDWNNPQNCILSAVASGYNVIVMGFYITGGTVADMAYSWANSLSEETRVSTMATVHAAGAVVLISLGGATDGQWTTNDPVATGTTIGSWAKQYHLDGVDLDLENSGTFAAVRGSESATVAQFASIISATRAAYGAGCIISIAPVAPWFGPVGMQKCTSNGQTGCSWVGPTGGMTGLYQQVGDQIDFFFVQFYNQGPCYTTQAGLMTQSGSGCNLDNWFPYTSVAEIVAQGVPAKKLVVGKPVNQGAASSGLVDPATLSSWLVGSKVGGTGIWMWDSAAGTGAIAWLAAAVTNVASWN